MQGAVTGKSPTPPGLMIAAHPLQRRVQPLDRPALDPKLKESKVVKFAGVKLEIRSRGPPKGSMAVPPRSG
jgi:hypothetical protein